MVDMTETTATPNTSPEPAVPPARRPDRVYRAAAWVAIVAGVVFIVGAVFFTGFALGRHTGHGGPGGHHGRFELLERKGPPMMRLTPPMEPGMQPPPPGDEPAPGGPGRGGPPPRP